MAQRGSSRGRGLAFFPFFPGSLHMKESSIACVSQIPRCQCRKESSSSWLISCMLLTKPSLSTSVATVCCSLMSTLQFPQQEAWAFHLVFTDFTSHPGPAVKQYHLECVALLFSVSPCGSILCILNS